MEKILEKYLNCGKTMEIIRLTENNIQELSDKLDDLGFIDFSPILKKKENGLDPGLFYIGFGEEASRLYAVKDNWEFQINDDGSIEIRHFKN